MLKLKRLILLFISLFFVLFFAIISFNFIIPGIGLVLFIWWLVYIGHAFTYKNILINDDYFIFDAILRKKTFPLETFKYANVCLDFGRGAVISSKSGRIASTYLNSNTKDGLIKIILFSENIKEKEKKYLIDKIKKGSSVIKLEN